MDKNITLVLSIIPKSFAGKTKRGGRKNKKKECAEKSASTLKYFFNNINGLMCKRESLNQSLGIAAPDIVGLCETKLGSKSRPKLQGYESVYHNLKRGKEGLLVAAKEGTFKHIDKVTIDTDDDPKNILAVQIRYPNFSLRVIVAHAPQETDKPNIREQFFQSIKVEVERGQLNGDIIVVMGDMNGRLSSDESANSYSPNGEFLKDLIDEHKLLVANFHPNSTGKWTRIQQKKERVEQSIIDYILVEEKTFSDIINVAVDECKAYTPYWVTRRKGERKVVFSDHCVLMMTVSAETGPIVESDSNHRKFWRITESGLEKYKDLTKTRNLFFSEEEKSTSNMYRLWGNYLEGILDKCFKKKTFTKRQAMKLGDCRGRLVRAVLNEEASKGKIQRETVVFYRKRLFEWEMNKLEESRVANLKDTLSHFSEDEKTPPNAYWKILKSVRGREKTNITSVMKEDGVEIFSEESIRHEILGEFKNRLRNREPAEGWENYVKVSNELVELLMSADVENCCDFTIEELILAIKKLKKRKAPGPDDVLAEFLIEAGEGILLPLLDIFNCVKKSKQPPKQWNSVIITIIYKNKGSRKSLINYRGIFLASIVAKVFERLLKNRMKTQMENVDLCQAGARTNRGPPDNTFIVNAAIDHSIYVGKSLYITAYDFEQAFDSLWLQDCILSLRKLGVPDYILQLIYNLNREALITVNTPYGPTSSALIEDIVQQGRVLAPDLCSAATGEYCGTNKGVAVGTCIISTLAFVDDLLDLSESASDAEEANLHATVFSQLKKMLFNSQGKCKGMIVNKKSSDAQPTMFARDKIIEILSEIDYLGDIFQQNGKNSELVKDRLKRGLQVILKIEAIMAETQFGKHTIEVSLLLYRALFLSSILFNSQAWRNLTKPDFSKLQTLQLRLLKKLVNAPSSISSSFIYLELGVLPIKYEIQKRQLTFLHHIVNLNDDDPVRMIYENMKRLPYEPNWLNDILKSCTEYSINIDEQELRSISKETFKSRVRSAIHDYAFCELKKDCLSQSKTKNLVYNTFEKQPYLTHLYPSQAKIILQCRAQCLKIKAHRPFLFSNKICRWCNLEEETVDHIVNCGRDKSIDTVNIDDINDLDPSLESLLVSIATRISHFIDLVDY